MCLFISWVCGGRREEAEYRLRSEKLYQLQIMQVGFKTTCSVAKMWKYWECKYLYKAAFENLSTLFPLAIFCHLKNDLERRCWVGLHWPQPDLEVDVLRAEQWPQSESPRKTSWRKDCICGDPESPRHSFCRRRASSSPFRGKGIHPSSLGSLGGGWKERGLPFPLTLKNRSQQWLFISTPVPPTKPS